MLESCEVSKLESLSSDTSTHVCSFTTLHSTAAGCSNMFGLGTKQCSKAPKS